MGKQGQGLVPQEQSGKWVQLRLSPGPHTPDVHHCFNTAPPHRGRNGSGADETEREKREGKKERKKGRQRGETHSIIHTR